MLSLDAYSDNWNKQAGAELGQAQIKLEVMVEVVVKFKDEIVVKVGVSTTSPVVVWVGQKIA